MNEHTPGPWFVHRSGSRGLPHIRNADGIYVMDAPPRSGRAHASVRQDADARLICAAPELLESLRELAELAVLQLGMPPPGADGPLQKALAAIAKADGDTTWTA